MGKHMQKFEPMGLNPFDYDVYVERTTINETTGMTEISIKDILDGGNLSYGVSFMSHLTDNEVYYFCQGFIARHGIAN